MKPRIYVDTSVVGGCEDEEFAEHSVRLMECEAVAGLFDRQEPVSGQKDLDTRRSVAHHFACDRDDDPARPWILENRALQRTELAGTCAGIVEIRANLD